MSKKEINVSDKVLKAILKIQNSKRSANKYPDHVLLVADRLYEKLSDNLTPQGFRLTLQRLKEDGLIETGNTVNDRYVRLAEPRHTENSINN